MGGVFPGAANLDEFWANIVNRVDSSREPPPGRWTLDPADAVSEDVAADKVYSTRACFVEHDPPIDDEGLNLDPQLIAGLDPLYRIVLRAGIDAFRASRSAGAKTKRTGVILASIALPTEGASELSRAVFAGDLAIWRFGDVAIEEEARHSADHQITKSPNHKSPEMRARVTSLPATLLARALSLGGPAFTLDAACASSLYAIKLSCDELQLERADAMLAGGASRPDSLFTQMGFSQLRALSPSGRCRPFDAAADGLIVGEGAGIVLLKRLGDALRDGDSILGVIRGIGLSNDIGGSLLAPDSEGQQRAMRAAHRCAGWSPADVDLVECHGTGTPLGDAAELSGLRALWGETGWRPGQCAVGSVKSNVGHLLTAAGAAGLIKTLLAMRAGQLPPSANFSRSDQRLKLDQSPFRVQTRCEPWVSADDRTPRRAAVNGFGFGGINAQLLVEEHLAISRSGDLVIGKKAPPAINRQITRSPNHQIAIVGLAARFGRAASLREFQQHVLSGSSALREPPPDRWRGGGEIIRAALGSSVCPGGYLDEIGIPFGRFRLPPNETPQILPQQLLMLLVAAEAMDDANLPLRERRERAGAIIGTAFDYEATNFHLRWHTLARQATAQNHQITNHQSPLDQLACPALNATRTLGALGNIIASRIAREFSFGGPSFAVSGEELSGMHALRIAVDALRCGETDLMIVGAVDLAGDVRSMLLTHKQRPFSPSGHARPFDAMADGTLPGDGACALVLKRLDDAHRDGDRIYALVSGIAFGDARQAYDEAGVLPETVDYIETHGSGDPTEDRAEAEALHALFGERPGKTALGALTPIIGHVGAAAALASVTKACLCLYQRIVPPIGGFQNPRQDVRWNSERFCLPRLPSHWLRDREHGSRRAGVNAVTADGRCGHVVLEEASNSQNARIEVERRQPLGARGVGLFVVAAEDPQRLSIALDRLHEYVSGSDMPIEQLARGWHREHRRDRSARLAVSLVASDCVTLCDSIVRAQEALRTEPPTRLSDCDGVYYNPVPLGRDARIAFVFPGSGNHFVGMGRELGVEWPEILRAIDDETEQLARQLIPHKFVPWRNSWMPGWEQSAADDVNTDVLSTIFAQVSHGVVVSDLLQHLGVRPNAAIGYSLGESAAMFALRAWRDRDEMFRRMTASPLFRTDLTGPCDAVRKAWNIPPNETIDWCVVVVDRPAEVVRSGLRDAKVARARLLIVNTPGECVVGGLRRDVDRLVATMGCNAVPLEGVASVHCDVLNAVSDAYRELHLLPVSPPPGVQFYSAYVGRRIELTRESAADSILNQALHGFDFPVLIDQAYEDGVRAFVEIGPQASCTRMIANILEGRPHLAVSASNRDQSEVEAVLGILASLIAERIPISLDALYGDETCVVGHVRRDEAVQAERVIRVPVGGPSLRAIEAEPASSQPDTSVSIAIPYSREMDESSPFSVGREVVRSASADAEAHDAFLRFSQKAGVGFASVVAYQRSLAATIESAGGALPPPPVADVAAFTREQCFEFARGAIANVLGPEFAEIDAHPTRVRLPDEPLMLVDRIISVEGEPRSLTRGKLITEHDVIAGAWYLDGGRAPVFISVEAGQADLFLSGYLGIDFATRGLRMYRLLDATVQFHRGLPRPGETIRYEIEIERFIRQGDTWLFAFNFDATIAGEPFLSMTAGRAGFFTLDEVRSSGGIVLTDEDQRPTAGRRPDDWSDLTSMRSVEAYDDRALNALRQGDLAGCFGSAFAGLPLREPVGLPPRITSPDSPPWDLKLIDRIVELDPTGGRFGLGRIRAEADVRPDDWYLTCHFVDDMTMPGTLMYEYCVHALRVFLLRMGWVAERDEVCYEPIPGIATHLSCRGPVTQETRKVIYQVDLKEIGYGPEPYAIADALMFADGKRIVRFGDMTVKLTGLTRERIESIWRNRPHAPDSAQGRSVIAPAIICPIGSADMPTGRKPPIFDQDRILAFAIGNPSEAFGDPYRVFDRERRIARLPGPPYQFLDRITEVHAEPWRLEAGGWIESQYDVPPDAWYFRANGQTSMPFSVLLEVGLQPCGWLAAYLGSALQSETDLSFRNLGGTATQHVEILPDAGTLTARVRITNVAKAGGMIIEDFDIQIWNAARIVYEGCTSFGFFSAAALAQQVGVRDAAERLYHPSRDETLRTIQFPLPDHPPLTPDDSRSADASPAALPGRAFRMIDDIDHLTLDGGPHGLGFVRGITQVDPSAWFFKAHFHQDPVWPGSLGLESFLQLLKIAALQRWGESFSPTHRFTPQLIGCEHSWKYRGQIIPTNKRVTVEAAITKIDDDPAPTITADGFLHVDGVTIYEMSNFGVCLMPIS